MNTIFKTIRPFVLSAAVIVTLAAGAMWSQPSFAGDNPPGGPTNPKNPGDTGPDGWGCQPNANGGLTCKPPEKTTNPKPKN